MRFVHFLTIPTIAVAANVATAQDVTIDFDDIDTSSSASVPWPGNQYATKDVLFATNGGALGAFRVSWADTAPNVVCGSVDPVFLSPDASVEATFVDRNDSTNLLVSQEVSFWIVDSDFGGGLWTAQIYDVAGNLLDQTTGTVQDRFIHFERNVPEIHRVVFLPSPDREGMDTLVFDAPVEPGLWIDLGFALAGSSGAPALAGTGTLEAGDPVTLELRNALPGAPAFLVVGLQFLGAPLFGGTLVPSLDLLVPGFVVDAAGELVVSDLLPAGIPSGTDLFFQAWIVDPLGPRGFAASNGLQATTP